MTRGGRRTPSRASDAAFLLGTAGWSFFVISFVARLPLAMTLVGSLLFITEARSSLADAALVSGAVGVSSAAGGPVLGAASDQWGQRRVLVLACIANSLGFLGLVLVGGAGTPLIAVIVCAVLAGFSSPQIGPMTRARWMGIARSGRRSALDLVLGYESTIEEVTFIVGPILVAVLGSSLGAGAPLIIAAGITLVFGVVFALHPTHTHSMRRGRAEVGAPMSHLLQARVLVTMAGMVVMGGFWGASLAVATSAAEQAGRVPDAGLVYGSMAVSSAVAALGGGLLLPRGFGAHARWVTGSVVLVASSLVACFVGSLELLAACFFAAGFGVGLVIASLFALAAEVAPNGRANVTMTLMNSSLIVGRALATVGAAWVISLQAAASGPVTLVAITTALLLTGMCAALLARSRQRRGAGPVEARGM